MPEMKLIEEIRIDVEEVERRRVGQPHDLHVAQQKEEIVQLSGLQPQLTLVLAVGDAVQKVAGVLPGHAAIVSGTPHWGIEQLAIAELIEQLGNLAIAIEQFGNRN
jgi:hypothetical protein